MTQFENADCPFEQVFGLKKTGPLARVEENPAATVYQHEVTIIDGPNELLFLSVDKDKRGPWEDVLEEQGYRRSEVQDVVLWVGPPPWEALCLYSPRSHRLRHRNKNDRTPGEAKLARPLPLRCGGRFVGGSRVVWLREVCGADSAGRHKSNFRGQHCPGTS